MPDDAIFLPKSRQHKLLDLLNLTGEPVTEILLTSEGGLVTRYKTDIHGNFITGPDGEKVTETVEISFVDMRDPLRSRRKHDD